MGRGTGGKDGDWDGDTGTLTPAVVLCTSHPTHAPTQVNASDTRSKADSSVLKGIGGKLSNSIKELSTNASLAYDGRGQRKKVGGGRVALWSVVGWVA